MRLLAIKEGEPGFDTMIFSCVGMSVVLMLVFIVGGIWLDRKLERRKRDRTRGFEVVAKDVDGQEK